MAHQKSITQFLYSVQDQVGLEVFKHEWRNLNIDLFDYEVSFNYDGRKLTGRGVDATESIALEKASSEALEKYICNTYNIDSEGLSVGINFNTDLHAKSEALERFFLKKHLDKDTKFEKIAFSTDLIKNTLSKNPSVRANLFRLKSDFACIGCILTLNGHKSSGFALAFNESTAADKAFTEALPNLDWLNQENVTDDEKPWHIKSKFISRIESLHGYTSDPIRIKTPQLEKMNISAEKDNFLKNLPLSISKYYVSESQT